MRTKLWILAGAVLVMATWRYRPVIVARVHPEPLVWEEFHQFTNDTMNWDRFNRWFDVMDKAADRQAARSFGR